MPNAQSGFFEWVLFLAKSYAPLLLRGAGVTLLLALSGTLVGFLIGLGVGVVRSIPCRREDGAVKYVLLKIVRGILSIYIEVFRSTPMIVQAMVIYYGIAQLFALTLNQLLAGFLIVSVNTGAYLAEIVRGGIQSVDPGPARGCPGHRHDPHPDDAPRGASSGHPQRAARAWATSSSSTSRTPRCSTSSPSRELFFISKSAAGTYYKYFEVFFITSVIYFVMTFATTRLLRLLEKKMDGPENYTIHGSQTVPEGEIKLKGENAQ